MLLTALQWKEAHSKTTEEDPGGEMLRKLGLHKEHARSDACVDVPKDQLIKLINSGDVEEVEKRRAAISKAGDDPDDPKLILPFKISDERRDRDGDRIKANGGRFATYRTNPIVAPGHSTWLSRTNVPVARSARVWRDLSAKPFPAVRALGQFMPPELDAFSTSVYGMYKGGFLNAVSIGFMPISFEKDPELTDEEAETFRWGGFLFKVWELLEWSPVMIPSNAGALQGAKSAGVNMKAYLEEIERAAGGAPSHFGKLDALTLATLKDAATEITPTFTTVTEDGHNVPARHPYRGVEHLNPHKPKGKAPVATTATGLELTETPPTAEPAPTFEQDINKLAEVGTAIIERLDTQIADLLDARDDAMAVLAHTRDKIEETMVALAEPDEDEEIETKGDDPEPEPDPAIPPNPVADAFEGYFGPTH